MRLWSSAAGRSYAVSLLSGYGQFYAYIPKDTDDLSACVRVTLPDKAAIKQLFDACAVGRWFPDQFKKSGDWIWQVRQPDEVLMVLKDVLGDLPQRKRKEVTQHIDFIQRYEAGERPKPKTRPFRRGAAARWGGASGRDRPRT